MGNCLTGVEAKQGKEAGDTSFLKRSLTREAGGEDKFSFLRFVHPVPGHTHGLVSPLRLRRQRSWEEPFTAPATSGCNSTKENVHCHDTCRSDWSWPA